ncbi:PQQ-like beta-propeller repeat protein [Cellulomonas iranensis]|uniref:outer membrane protein assembly factor BamB family protein n=1 Tax=Cellulomonas iranensis TaxID=76862 RepID=UPI001CF2ED52|nr:PQQ-binding-like beta-propeller repeat protein [Cellulomonas iranensis]UCN16063.1 PQQ-like beta-propeller repeat protein [Cellulomonas iranensis]
MGGTRPGARMRPVELVDEDDERPTSVTSARHGGAGPGDEGPDDGSTAGDGSPSWRRWWPWVVGVAVLAVSSAGVATVQADALARERADRIARVPGMVRPVEQAPAVRWRAPAEGPAPAVAAGGALILLSVADGTWTARAHDPATGDVRWELPLVEQPGAGFESLVVTCAAGDAQQDVLLCAWAEPDVLYGGAEVTTPYAPPTRVVAVDPSDGAVLGEWEAAGPTLGVTRVDDDLVVAVARPDRRVTVERRAGTSGEVRWSWTSPESLVDPTGVRVPPRLVADRRVVTMAGIAPTVLDARSGDVIRSGGRGRQMLARGLPDGGYVLWVWTVGAELRAADGTVRGEVPALPVRLVTDGSLDGWLLVDTGNQVEAVAAQDGAPRWRLTTPAEPVAAVDGVVVLARDATVLVVDGGDGRELWERREPREMLSDPVTDGLHAIVAVPGRDATDLVARGLHDGVLAWDVALPADVEQVVAVGGRLVALTAAEALVLG